jgi:hypothetical protein
MEYLQTVLTLVAGLVGFPTLLAALINALKYLGWLSDGNAPAASMIGHLIAYVGVGVLAYLGKVDVLPGLDVQLGSFANILLAVLAFLSSLGTAGKAHNRLSDARVPVIGFSYPWSREDLPE